MLALLPAGTGWGQEGAEGEGPPPQAVVVPEDPAPKAMTESLSKQFVVHGATLKVRSAVATLAEETREALIKEVGEPGESKNKIVIELRGKPGDPVPPNLFAVSPYALATGFRLQLDVHMARGIDGRELERHLVELLIYERSLRERNPVGFEDRLLLPDWLLEGFLETFRWRRKDVDRAMYVALSQRKGLFTVEQLLQDGAADGLMAGERAAFRASAGALVMALMQQEDGKEGMQGFLGEVATFEGQQLALLMKHFPGMNLGQKSLEKWWALQLARMAEAQVTEMMTVAETEKALTEILQLRFPDGQGGDIVLTPGQFRDVVALDVERRTAAVQPVADSLSLLQFRAFPGHRPIILGYLGILSDLVADRDEDMAARVAELDEARGHLTETGKRVRDLLEWYHITTAREVSGEFEDYMKTKEALERDPTPRTGPISEYLDSIQKIYERE